MNLSNLPNYSYNSPIGILQIIYDENFIFSLLFGEIYKSNNKTTTCSTNILETCISQLDEYFSHKRKTFSVPINAVGTEFQKKVWNQLEKIPFGTTVSYKYIATQIGNPKASRAVGLANNKNPISIIIPCHRVVASNGSLAGFGGGIWRKKWLLNHELF